MEQSAKKSLNNLKTTSQQEAKVAGEAELDGVSDCPRTKSTRQET